MDGQGALHVAEELDAGGVASLNVLMVGYLRGRETGGNQSEVKSASLTCSKSNAGSMRARSA